MWCPLTEKLITDIGRTYTGITDIGRGYVRSRDTLYSETKNITLAPNEQESRFFIESNDFWYIPSGGNCLPLLDNSEKHSLPLIITPLDSISYATWLYGKLVVFGRK